MSTLKGLIFCVNKKLGPFMGKNEENEDARIASSSRGFKKYEDQGF